MEIGIIGPGAIGSFIAFHLARSGRGVTLIDRDSRRASRLTARGVTVLGCGQDEAVRMPVVTAASLAAAVRSGASPPLDIIIFAVKAYDTASAARQIAPSVRDGAAAVTLQNGLGNAEALAAGLPRCRVVVGATWVGVTSFAAGVARRAGLGPTVLGPRGEATLSDCEVVASLLSEAGMETTVVADAAGAVWEKVCVNAAINPLTAILGVSNGALAESPDSRRIMKIVIEECETVARSQGVSLERGNRLERAMEVCHNTAGNLSSMLQDIRRGKPTEIDQINGAIADLAAKSGLGAPANYVLAAIVRILSQKMAQRTGSSRKEANR